MSNINNKNQQIQDKALNNENIQQIFSEKLSMNYVLEQIEKIAIQTEYLNTTIEKLGQMSDGDSAESMSPGNTLGQAKAQALGDVVRCRETTNQQLLKIYEKMYDDLKVIYTSKSNTVSRFDEMANWLKTLNIDEFSPSSYNAIQEAAKNQLSRHF